MQKMDEHTNNRGSKNQRKIIKSFLTSKDTKHPNLVLLLKDHKDDREDVSKLTRPLCLAHQVPNRNLSEILRELSDKVADILESK